MKIVELLKKERKGRLSPLKARVLAYLKSHPDEVFQYRDETLTRTLKVKPSALSFTLWALHSDGLIDKERVEGKTYFGSHRAIEELRQQRQLRSATRSGASPQDPMAQAQAVRESIRARAGILDGLALLQASRQRED